MSGAPARGTVPRRQRRHHHHHHHHQKHQKRVRDEVPRDEPLNEPEEKRPKINPIFLWASQREQRIIEVRCEDYDKRNRIKLTKTAQGWRSIPRTTSNVYTIALGGACKKTAPGMTDTSPASSVSSNDEKENGKRCLQEPVSATASSLRCHPRMYSSNGTMNGLLTGEGAGRKKRGFDEETNRRSYTSPLGARAEINDDKGGEKNSEEGKNREQNKLKDRLSSLKNKDKLNGWINLQRLQMDKLFQPRVVLELLQLSQLPESAHQNVVRHARNKDATANEAKRIEENNEKNAVAEEEEEEREEEIDNEEMEEEDEEEEEEEKSEKSNRMNKAGIQDILNMIDATASPVLATDTPSADLPVDSTKTYEVLDEKQSAERQQVKDTELDDMKDQTRDVSSYEAETIDQDGEIDDKLEVHEEKILEEDCYLQEKMEDKKIRMEDNLGLLSLKNNTETTSNSCKIAEADGSFVDRSKCGSDSIVIWRPSIPTEEEEAPDEPGEPPVKLDYGSSKILDALRNTPGLSVSVMRNHTSEIGKNSTVSPARPSSKASSSSRSPDSQAECVEKLLKNANDFGRDGSPRNLPGLSIVIPSYRYKSVSNQLTTSPNTKHRVESPESTVSFNKVDMYPEMKVDSFPHEDRDEEEDEDDCDSQVLEDLRQQKADSLAYDGIDADYYNGSGIRSNQEDRKTPLENMKNDHSWIGSGRNSEAQAKGKYQDLEHFDEQVLEELRSRGTVVSPQPSGIPCSPASRRPSSAYLERLLPSPPCSVSCSEDAKNELTLKSILASSSADPRDYERTKEGMPIRSDQSIDQPLSRPVHSSIDKNVRRTNQRSFQERLNVHNQEARNSGRPMSSGDIHSTFYATTERTAPKRPMSAEWQSTIGQRQRNQAVYYQKTVNKTKGHFTDQDQITCSTSSSTDKFLDPARQLRELIETVGHLIPDPLLVPRDYLPGLAAAPATEIPKLLASRPELRLPEALTRPDLLRDPDLLVISLAHLQHVLDHGEGPVSRSRQSPSQQPKIVINGTVNKGSSGSVNGNSVRGNGFTGTIVTGRPKLSCKPICTLMPMQPIDLSNGGRSRVNPYSPLLRVRSGLLKQEPEVSSTASSPDESQLWHPLFGSQKRQQQQQQQLQQQQQQLQQQHQQLQQQHQQQQPSQAQLQQQQQQQQHASWHRTTLAS